MVCRSMERTYWISALLSTQFEYRAHCENCLLQNSTIQCTKKNVERLDETQKKQFQLVCCQHFSL